MFKNSKFKKSLAITLLILMFSTVVFAANGIYDKKLTATHGRIKFMVDGKDVTKQVEDKYKTPAFVVKEYDERAYVPLRAIADLMGVKVDYDNNTHTAEIIDVKSEKYEKELAEKDNEIKKLKEEIEKLKKNVVEETDLKAVEKKLNGWYGTYKDVDFDIKLKESKSRIDVDIIMDLRDGRQESYWNRMTHSERKEMIEDIADTIAKEFPNVDIYGSVYDNFYRRDVMSFNKKKGKSTSISYDSRGYDDRYLEDEIDYIVRKEFYDFNVYVDDRGNTIYVDISLYGDDRYDWRILGATVKNEIMKALADDIEYYYYYDNYFSRIIITVDGDDSYTRSLR